MQGLVAVKYTSLLFFDTTGEDGVVLMCTCIPSDGFFLSASGCVAVLSRATGFIPKSVEVVYFLTSLFY